MEKVHLIYLFCLGLGGLGLLSSLIFGEFHDGDFHHDIGGGHDAGDADSPRLFSLRVIFAFLLAFGLGGGAMFLTEKSVGAQILVGLLSGVLTGVGTYYLLRILYSFQGNSNVNSDSFIGKTAVVTVETTKTGMVQVKLDTEGGDQFYIAQESNNKTLKKNDLVKIAGRIGNTFIVTKQ